MKRFLAAGLIFCLGITAWAYEPVWLASHTTTADTTQILCLSHTYLVNGSTVSGGGRGILHEICVNDAPSVAGAITVYNSSSTAVNAYAVLRATAATNSICVPYDVTFSSGLVYTTSNANDVTFVYTCY